MRNGPRRGEVQYGYGGRDGYQGNGQYSSQDSLPDSPYSSQSLDSHASQGGPGLCFSCQAQSIDGLIDEHLSLQIRLFILSSNLFKKNEHGFLLLKYLIVFSFIQMCGAQCQI